MDESKSSGMHTMPDNEKLCYDAAKNASNVVDFEPKLLVHARIIFGSQADQILKKKVIPSEWTDPYVYPTSPPEGRSNWNNLEVARMTAESDKRDKIVTKWKEYTLPRFISFLQLSLHPTGVTRIASIKDAEFKAAVNDMDVLEVHKIMIESHSFIQGGVGFRDDDATRKEHSNFTYNGSETLQAYILRYTRLQQKLVTCGVTNIDSKKMVYRFLEGLLGYTKSEAVNLTVVRYVANVDSKSFPTDLDAIQQELKDLDRVQNPVESAKSKIGNPYATVNVTDVKGPGPTPANLAPKGIRMFADGVSVGYQEPDGTYRVFTAKGISKKLRFEPGSKQGGGDDKNGSDRTPKPDKGGGGGGGKSKTPYTDRYVNNQVKKTGKTKKEILEALECLKCGKRHGVVAKECKNPPQQNAVVNALSVDKSASWEVEGEEEIETPAHLKGFFSLCMAHGMSKPATEEDLEDEDLRRRKNYNSVNIDDHSNIHLFCNKRLLTNVKKLKTPVKVVGVGGMFKNVEYVGEHPLLGEVLYDPDNGYNIMSMDLLEELGYVDRKSEDRQTLFLYHKENKSVIAFKKDPFDRFWKCPVEQFDAEILRAFPLMAQLHRETFCYPMSAYYTVEQQRRAQEAIQLHQALDHPSDRALTALLGSPSMINVPITANDLANARAIYGPCPHCLEGKPKPHVGKHQTFDPGGEPTKPGQLLHADIVFINGKPRMIVVDHVSGKGDLIIMPSKSQASCCDAFETIIHSYKSNLKVVRMISCDSEKTLISCEKFLNGLGVKLALRIPYEHEKYAERYVRVLRERMETKIKELPYRLPAELYDALAVECVRTMNLVPNSKSMPYTPQEMVTDEKFNYLTDFTVPFGMPVLCDAHGGKKKQTGTAYPQEVGICLGPAVNVKGGSWVYIPGRQEALVRRGLEPNPLTKDLVDFMNNWHDTRPEEGVMLKFRETLEYSEEGASTGAPDEFDRFVNDLDNKQEQSVGNKKDNGPKTPPPPFATPSKTYDPAPSTPKPMLESKSPITSPSPKWMDSETVQKISEVEFNMPMEEPVAVEDHFQSPAEQPSSNPSPKKKYVPKREPKPEDNVRRSSRLGGKHVQIYSISAYLQDRYQYDGYSNLPRSQPGVFASAGNITVRAALKSDHAMEAKAAISKELTQLVKIKAWKYLKNAGQASASVHSNITPCSMFLKKKYDSQGEFLLWKARLVGGGHRTDPNAFEPFETHSPTVPLEVAMMQLGVASFEKANVETFDIPCAYLNASLKPDRQQLMRFPKDLAEILVETDPEARRYLQPDGTILVQVQRALYGFPESAKLWNEYMTAALISAGYTQSKAEACLFRKQVTRGGVKEWSTITLYVDDCLHVHNSERLKRELYAKLRDANLPAPTVQVLNYANSISYLGMNIAMKGPHS